MIQAIVQIVSMVLGALQICAIQSALTMSINIRMLSTTASLNELKFWDALRQGKLDCDLRYRPMAILTIYFLLLQIPSALWAGAITPLLMTTGVHAELSIPNYSQATAGYWGTICQPGGGCENLQPLGAVETTLSTGTFTYIGWKCKLTLQRLRKSR